jgi:hypothetical protein
VHHQQQNPQGAVSGQHSAHLQQQQLLLLLLLL